MDLPVVQGTLKSLLQHHSSKASTLQCLAFFMVQLSHQYMTTGRTIALTVFTNFVGKVMSLLFNMLSRLVIAFLPRSKLLLVSWLWSPYAAYHVTPWLLCTQLLSCVRLFANPWMAAHQASLSITNSQSLLKLMSIESVMPSNHLILCHPLLLLPSIFPSIRVFSNESVLLIRWPSTGASASASVLPVNIQD